MSKMHLMVMTDEGEAVPLRADRGGNLNSEQSSRPWRYVAGSGGITDDTPVAIKAAAGVGLCNYLSSIQVQNADGTVGTEVVIQDGSTVIWRGFFAALNLSDNSFHFDPALVGSQNTALNAAAITTSAIVYLNAQGYVARPPTFFEEANVSVGEELYDDLGIQLTDSTGSPLFV